MKPGTTTPQATATATPPSTNTPKYQEPSAKENFHDVLGYAGISEEFNGNILATSRIWKFRRAANPDSSQIEMLHKKTVDSKDDGYMMDFLQFLKLLRAGRFYTLHYKAVVPWSQFTEDEVADLLDEYMANENGDTDSQMGDQSPMKAPPSPSANSVQQNMANLFTAQRSTTTSNTSSSYAKKSLKIFEDLKFPPTPITYTQMKSFKTQLKNKMRSVNLKHFLDPNFYPPQIGDKDYEQFLQDNKFVYSVIVELVMNPDHEAHHIILTDDVEDNGKAAWVKLIGHYDNETIEKSFLSSLYNRWNSL